MIFVFATICVADSKGKDVILLFNTEIQIITFFTISTNINNSINVKSGTLSQKADLLFKKVKKK